MNTLSTASDLSHRVENRVGARTRLVLLVLEVERSGWEKEMGRERGIRIGFDRCRVVMKRDLPESEKGRRIRGM